jgi:glycosyltransferase involved in cell wall biosynthesis
VSDYVLRTLERIAPSVVARTLVVRNGVDTAYWSPREGASARGPRLRVVVVCRLTGWKRVHLAVAAAGLAGVDLVVVGDGEERARLERLARDLGARVEFAGHQKDPRPFLASSDVTLSAAEDEPLGLSVLESLAMERPVVAFAGGGIPEIVLDGVTGLLVKEVSASGLASALSSIGADRGRLHEMGVAARRSVVARCDVRRMREGYGRVYAELQGRVPAP